MTDEKVLFEATLRLLNKKLSMLEMLNEFLYLYGQIPHKKFLKNKTDAIDFLECCFEKTSTCDFGHIILTEDKFICIGLSPHFMTLGYEIKRFELDSTIKRIFKPLNS